ncbi:MAG: S41 family peptidase [Bacteroidota bacterium]
MSISRIFPAMLLILLLGTVSCEQVFLDEAPEEDPLSIFEEAWTFADQEYSFFSFKGIDWDEVYNRYRPQVQENMSEEALFEVMADMLFELRDGHVNLRSPFNLSRNWEWYLNSPENFNASNLERTYFQQNQQFVGSLVIWEFADVGYIRYGSFSSPLADDDIDLVINKFQDKKGIIFDVRNNGGGSLSNVFRLVRRFTDVTRTLAAQREKNGPGRNDFSDWSGYSVSPEGPLQYTKPVIVLTNRRCYSATTFFCTMMQELPNVTLVGDTTGGGGGAPSATELANGWTLRVSTTQLGTIDGFNVEDGLPPDVRLDMDPELEARGIDSMLEYAISELN